MYTHTDTQRLGINKEPRSSLRTMKTAITMFMIVAEI